MTALDRTECQPIPKETRPWHCKKGDENCTRKEPCISCRNRRNRQRGQRKQREALKVAERVLGQHAGPYASQRSNEEAWRLTIRGEHKVTRQSGAVVTFYRNCQEQSEKSRAIGDLRPFVAMASMNGTGQVVWVIDANDAVAFAEAVLSI